MSAIEDQIKFMKAAQGMADAISAPALYEAVEVGKIPPGYIAFRRTYIKGLEDSWENYRQTLVELSKG